MSPFYTRGGDGGTTGLLGSERVDKSELRIEVLGTLDEVSAAIGLARSLNSNEVNELLKKIQVQLYELMAEVAATDDNIEKFSKIDESAVQHLEVLIDEIGRKVQLPSTFILPGDNPASAALSVARTVTRRAERRMVALSLKQRNLRKPLLMYINRLSSLLYILEIHTVQSDQSKTLSTTKKAK